MDWGPGGEVAGVSEEAHEDVFCWELFFSPGEGRLSVWMMATMSGDCCLAGSGGRGKGGLLTWDTIVPDTKRPGSARP